MYLHFPSVVKLAPVGGELSLLLLLLLLLVMETIVAAVGILSRI
jgi:hypothetical protein